MAGRSRARQGRGDRLLHRARRGRSRPRRRAGGCALRRLVAGLAAAAILVGAGFAWGFLAHRQKVFPYPTLRAAWTRLQPEGRPKRKVIESQSPALAVLQSLPYVDAKPAADPRERGVLRHDPERSWPGYNLYYSRRRSFAQLLDMEGEEIHRWSYPSDSWQHVELLPDGGLLVIVKDRRLLRLDIRSRLLWSWDARVHHDLSIHGGEIHVLTRTARADPAFHPEHPVLEDAVTTLSLDGAVRERISVLEILRSSPYAFLLPRVADLPLADGGPLELDPLHVNHVEVFDGALTDRSPLFAEGNLLLSARNVNAVFILDGESHEILWLWGPTNLTFQHHPTLLDSGRILIFNNGSERSELLEVDPLTDEITWRYRADHFFTALRGSNQRLPNGNTLITESDTGRVFEITPDGEVVWELANPDVDEEGERGVIWRMSRFAPSELSFLPERLR